MNLKKLSLFIGYTVLALTGMLTAQSCQEDDFDAPDYTRSGEEVLLRVGLSLPDMEVRSRANLNTTQLNTIESLWVRTYSAETGMATSKWVKQTPNSTDTEVARTVDIKTLSGRSYIVAIANVGNCLGVTRTDLEEKNLSDLLEAADTWQQFLDIAVVAPSSYDNVYAPPTPLPMAGCYSRLAVGAVHPSTQTWANENYIDYFIPATEGKVTLEGAIHLRRLVSHINFNVIPGDDVDITVNSYQVMNVPKYSWLYERRSEAGNTPNFGDLAQSEEEASDYYTDVPQFGSQNVNVTNRISSFNFWQGENKHTGTSETYAERGLKSAENPKHFVSLLNSEENWSSDNEASYVLVNCTVEYKNQLNVNNQGVETAGGTIINRTGEATYLIHLGYINGTSEADKSKDFNCYRNVNYTYNLTVNGVDDIRVDAFADIEQYHNEEGMVVDLDNSTIDIDAHYAVFNVELTQDELSAENFGFIIITYENGIQYTITDANKQVGSGTSINILDINGNTIDPKYYNWIELRPTTDPYVLAEYKPRYGANADGYTFLLTDLQGGWNNMLDRWKSSSDYYTVFVNEYTYEPMYTGTDGYADEQWNGQGQPTWMTYVNQDPRRFYIRVTQSVSPDGNSIYARSKYGISQQSLMTYYSQINLAPADGTIPAATAIAVERDNETFGLNLRHSFDGGTSTGNGRWNTAQYLNGASTSETNLSINRQNANQRPQWSTYIDATAPEEVAAVTNTSRLQGGPMIPGRTIEDKNPIKLNKVQRYASTTTHFTDPQSDGTYNIEAIRACLSRNRDNNGNGRIEPDELRWYVPSMTKYIGMVLGQAALPEKLMNFSSISQLPHVNTSEFTQGGRIDNSFYSRYMFTSSNNNLNILWGVEGTSQSQYNKVTQWALGLEEVPTGNAVVVNPWQVRCIRNLGSDMTNVANDDKVSIPYTHNETTRQFHMNYFNTATIRAEQFYGNGASTEGYMPVHTLNNASYNSVYRGFEYANADIEIPTDNKPVSSNFNNTYDRLITYINNNPCATANLNGTGWRVPNQLELTMLLNAGNILTASSDQYLWLSCTVNYFNNTDGNGSDDISNKYFLTTTHKQTNQLTGQNYSNAGGTLFIRCVRDIN